MTGSTILYGKPIAEATEAEVRRRAELFRNRIGRPPQLAAVLVGDDPASRVYVRNKEAACQRAGLESHVHRLPAETSLNDLLSLIEELNRDSNVDGILVQLPLPESIDERTVLDAIDPSKDVDGFHPLNVGLLAQGRPRFIPCTPLGILELLRSHQIDVDGCHAVVVGRSDIVGKPMALLLAQRRSAIEGGPANATVTIAHSRTTDLPAITRQADLLIVAAGRPRMITADMVRRGAVVIDVGINRVDGKLVGDVDFESVQKVSRAITPVPGGVGKLTVAMLLRNTLWAAEARAAADPSAV